MKPITFILLALALAPMSAHVRAADSSTSAPEVAAILPLCASCHGIDGISSEGLYPNLAGQKVEYLVKQLDDFKQRQRTDPVMNAMAEPLAPELIKALADYYASRPARP
ncbi:c-type cytochrome [Thauera sp. Sel9]|uniref:c-type cytochrome n=1 Tax=Thauera sp. Sel9 TaxID=2974299 RepID=UPI0021E1809E|nr:cytochrome c [Thauera sp. Sel9]MCV2216652.1 cytochrome c [Thauera sp. Sel9]